MRSRLPAFTETLHRHPKTTAAAPESRPSANFKTPSAPKKNSPARAPGRTGFAIQCAKIGGACAGEVWAGAPRNRPVPVHKYRTTYQLDSLPNVK